MVKSGWHYKFGDSNKVQAEITYKDKSRDYMGTRFYYNLNKLKPAIDDIYDTDSFLNQENVANHRPQKTT